MGLLGDISCYSPEAMARVPLRPIYGSSTAQPASKAAGTPMTLKMTCCTATSVIKHETKYNTCVAIGNVQRSIPEDSTAARKSTRHETNRRYIQVEDPQIWQEIVIQRGGKSDNTCVLFVITRATIAASLPQIAIKRLVDQAILGVAKRALICPESYLELLLNILCLSTEDGRPPEIALSGASSSSSVMRDVVPLNFANLWITSTASASRPMPERNRGLSNNVKVKNRTAHRERVIPPRMINR